MRYVCYLLGAVLGRFSVFFDDVMEVQELTGECSISIMTQSKPDRAATFAHMAVGNVRTEPIMGPLAALHAATKDSGGGEVYEGRSTAPGRPATDMIEILVYERTSIRFGVGCPGER